MSGRAKATVKAPKTKKDKAASQRRRSEGAFLSASPFEHVVSLQSTIGNQAVQRLFKSGLLQAKLKVGELNDIYEQEADRVADQMIATPAGPAVSGVPPRIQRFVGQRTGQMDTAPASVKQALAGPGSPLEPALRQEMEQRFGYDFSRVRVHSGMAAEQSAQDVSAHAYTVGRSIVFGAGLFSPGTREGRLLLAHELTHVVQQAGPVGTRVGSAVSHTLQRQPYKTGDKGAKRGSKPLTKGTMKWSLELNGDASARIQISFTPAASSATKTITFLQTVQKKAGSAPAMDVLFKKDYEPFYGADWDPVNKKWKPESAPIGYKNAPSTVTESAAYLYDEPMVRPGGMKMFESVAVEAETSATLGALRWGLREGRLLGAEDKDCTDAPSVDFGAAVERFYAPPNEVGSDPERAEWYDAILDEFISGDATLTADHEKQLDPIVSKLRGDPKLEVIVGGFGDAMDKDPSGASEHRAQAVANYLIGKGVRAGKITAIGYGKAWARYLPSMKEGRNRRVQLRLRYPE